MSEDDQIDNEGIKQRFRDAGCRVTDFDDGYFEVIRQPFPAASLVRANPYFVEFNTLVWARPSGFFARTRSRRDSLLNQMNQVTKVAKVTCDQSSIDSDEGGWRVQAMARFVTGRIESDYETEAIDHWVNLWLQDIANLILEDTGFEIVAILKDQPEEK
ncbi:hypothetical protein [Haloferula sp.]|uniref:hypothetical protein n=1 Tax=Haloferula sp. TaxID=2497595 RepID=UPI003C713FF6